MQTGSAPQFIPPGSQLRGQGRRAEPLPWAQGSGPQALEASETVARSEALPRAATGLPARFCSPACRVRSIGPSRPSSSRSPRKSTSARPAPEGVRPNGLGCSACAAGSARSSSPSASGVAPLTAWSARSPASTLSNYFSQPRPQTPGVCQNPASIKARAIHRCQRSMARVRTDVALAMTTQDRVGHS